MALLVAVPLLLPMPAAATGLLQGEDLTSLASLEFGFLSDGGVGLVDGTDSGSEVDRLPPASSPIAPPPPFGSSGSWRIQFQSGGGFGLEASEGSTALALVGVGFSHFIAEGLSLDIDLNLIYFKLDGPDAFAPNVDMLFRWHFWRREHWSCYIDGGAGLLIATAEVPVGGSNFNFTPQAGGGFSVDVGRNARLMVGARWFHVSNGSTRAENPGLDSVLIYAGLNLPF